MKTKNHNPFPVFFAGISGLVLTGWLVWSWEPNKSIKELAVLGLGFASLAILGTGLFRNRKMGLVLATGVCGLLVFNRLGILDWISGILLVLVLGLITLVN